MRPTVKLPVHNISRKTISSYGIRNVSEKPGHVCMLRAMAGKAARPAMVRGAAAGNILFGCRPAGFYCFLAGARNP